MKSALVSGQFGLHYTEWEVPRTDWRGVWVGFDRVPAGNWTERKPDWLKIGFHNEPLFSWLYTFRMADHSGCVVKDVDLLPIACWDFDFESRRRRGCLSLVSVVYCQVEVSATDLSLVQGVLPNVVCLTREASTVRSPWSAMAVEP